MPHPRELSNKGQGLIEAVLTLPAAIAIIATVVILSYRAVLFYYADFQLHEALICTDDQSIVACEAGLRSRVSRLLRFQESIDIKISKTGKTASGRVGIHKLHKANIYYKIWPSLVVEKEISFPLPTK